MNITRKFVWIFSGDILLSKKLDHLAGFIAYAFLLLLLTIVWDVMVEREMVKVEKNETSIYEMNILYNESRLNLASLNRQSFVEAQLEAKSSTLKAPTVPATSITAEEAGR